MSARNVENKELAYHGSECQPDWIIEWAYGEHDTLGLFSDDGTKGCKVDVKRRLFCASPLVDAVVGNFAIADGRVEFEATSGNGWQSVHEGEKEGKNTQGGLERRTTEILCKRCFETVIVVLEEIGKLEDLRLANLDRLEFSGSETLAQVGVYLEVFEQECGC